MLGRLVVVAVDETPEDSVFGVPDVVVLPEVQEEGLAEPGPSEEFTIVVDKEESNKFGITVMQEVDSPEVTVRSIGWGIIHEWNVSHPELRVTVGDKIILINGASCLSAEAVAERLRKDWFFKIVLQRPPA